MDIQDTLKQMRSLYVADPNKAVRGQGFIKVLHGFLVDALNEELTAKAKRKGIAVLTERTILGSTKPKDVDVAVVDPDNGPLMMIGVRSQMSSIGNNVLMYYEGIWGEATSLQERFPLSTLGYVYLHPLKVILEGKQSETPRHERYARMYAAITGRSGKDYKNLRGVYDHFAYMIVDFDQDPPQLRDDIVTKAVPDLDMRLETMVARMIATFKSRLVFMDDIFR